MIPEAIAVSTQNYSNYVCDGITSLNSYVDVVKIFVLHILMVAETEYIHIYIYIYFFFVVENLAMLLLCGRGYDYVTISLDDGN